MSVSADEPPEELPSLARTVEALLFLSSDPLSLAELAEATQAGEGAIAAALALLGEEYAPGRRGLQSSLVATPSPVIQPARMRRGAC